MRVVIAHEAGADLVYSQAASAVGAAQAGSKAAARAVQPKASPVF